MFNVLLQVLDDGRLTDGQGRTVDFKNTVVIMTSNIGSAAIAATSARAGDAAYEQMKREVTEALRAAVPARSSSTGSTRSSSSTPLTEADLGARSSTCSLADLARRLAEQDIVLELTPAAQGADRPRGHRPGVRGAAAQADDPAARGEPARPGPASRASSGRATGSPPTPTSRRARSCSRPRARPSSPRPAGATPDARATSRRRSAWAGDRTAGSPLDLPPTRRASATTASSSTSGRRASGHALRRWPRSG